MPMGIQSRHTYNGLVSSEMASREKESRLLVNTGEGESMGLSVIASPKLMHHFVVSPGSVSWEFGQHSCRDSSAPPGIN